MRPAKYTAVDIANAIIDLSLRDRMPISRNKLQALLFFAYEEYLSHTNFEEPLFDDPIIAGEVPYVEAVDKAIELKMK